MSYSKSAESRSMRKEVACQRISQFSGYGLILVFTSMKPRFVFLDGVSRHQNHNRFRTAGEIRSCGYLDVNITGRPHPLPFPSISAKEKLLGLELNGKRVLFTENVFYEFQREKIWRVWSVIDKAAIEAQI